MWKIFPQKTAVKFLTSVFARNRPTTGIKNFIKLSAFIIFARSSNGRTIGSGPVNRGSSPCLATRKLKTKIFLGFLNFLIKKCLTKKIVNIKYYKFADSGKFSIRRIVLNIKQTTVLQTHVLEKIYNLLKKALEEKKKSTTLRQDMEGLPAVLKNIKGSEKLLKIKICAPRKKGCPEEGTMCAVRAKGRKNKDGGKSIILIITFLQEDSLAA